MLRKITVSALALLALPAIASAQFEQGDYSFTLSGFVGAPKDTSGVATGIKTELGYFLTKELQIGIRQDVSFIDNNEDTPGVDSSGWGGRSAAMAAFHFDMGALQPYIAVVAGYEYPEFVEGTPFVAPEVGIKYFVNGTTYLYGNVAYYYTTSFPTNSFFEGGFGVGFRF